MEDLGSMIFEAYGPVSLADLGEKVLAEYIYIVDPAIGELQSKTVVLDGPVAPGAAGALPLATLHTERGEEVYLTPRSVYPDPLRGGDHVLVLCDAHVPPELGSGDLRPRPHAANTRAAAAAVDAAAAAAGAAPLFSMDQEYAALDPFTGLPPGVFTAGVPIYAAPSRARGPEPRWGGGPCCGGRGAGCGCGCGCGSASGSPGSSASCGGALAASLPGGCGCGGDAAAARLLLHAHAAPAPPPAGSPAARRARALSELHMRACLKAGLRYAGAASSPPPSAPASSSPLPPPTCGRWASYRIGPCAGCAEMGDQASVARFLLRRIGDDLGLDARLAHHHHNQGFGPSGGFGGAGGGGAGCGVYSGGGCATEFSTAASRSPEGGLTGVQRILSGLQAAHAAHAPGLARGAPGAGAAAAAAPFSVAAGGARAAVVIPTSTLLARAGPVIDRRPAGDCDPYLATALIAAGALGLPLPPQAARALAARSAAPAAAAAAPPPPASPAEAAARMLLGAAPAAALGAAAAAAARQLLLAAAGAGAAAPLPALPPAASSHGRCSPAAACRRRRASFDGSEAASALDDSEGEGSQDMLVSEIRRIDRAQARRGARGGGCNGTVDSGAGYGRPAKLARPGAAGGRDDDGNSASSGAPRGHARAASMMLD